MEDIALSDHLFFHSDLWVFLKFLIVLLVGSASWCSSKYCPIEWRDLRVQLFLKDSSIWRQFDFFVCFFVDFLVGRSGSITLEKERKKARVINNAFFKKKTCILSRGVFLAITILVNDVKMIKHWKNIYKYKLLFYKSCHSYKYNKLWHVLL